MNQEIDKILVRFFQNEATIKDLELLTEWLEDNENKEIFKAYAKINYLVDFNTIDINTSKFKTEFLKKINKKEKVSTYKKLIPQLKYAAVAIVIFSLGYLLQQQFFNQEDNHSTIVNNIKFGTDKATLTLHTGEEIELIKGKSFNTYYAQSDGVQIAYNEGNEVSSELKYNYLTIPRGGQFSVQLSDGTKIWLNSESQIKYPVSFIKNETRQVELIYGEAYFDVSSSENHNGSSFKVLQNQQEVQVLGTEFNVKAYKDDVKIFTTLVEGKVNVKTDNYEKVLVPNEQSSLNTKTNKIKVKSINVYNYTSWKEGVFSFDNQSLKEIFKVLSRWYDVDVVIKTKKIEKEKFNGVLEKDQNLEEILATIKSFGIIENFEIKGKKVILE